MRRPLALVVAVVLLAACSNSGTQKASSSTPAAPNILTGSIGAANYTIDVPQPWNGTLLLYSHGYVAPGSTNPTSASQDPVTGQWLLAGYSVRTNRITPDMVVHAAASLDVPPPTARLRWLKWRTSLMSTPCPRSSARAASMSVTTR